MTGIAITFDERADQAAAAVLEELLDAIEENYAGAIDGRDPESLHDFRVAARRTRAVQRELKSALPSARLAHFRDEFRWLQRRRGARLEMEDALRSARTIDLVAECRALLQCSGDWPDHDNPGGSRPVGNLAGARIRKLYRRMVKIGRSIGPSSAPEDYHEFRKQGKELRYMLELFGGRLYPEDVVRPMVKPLKGLRGVLGHHQDREVQIGLLRSLEGKLTDGPEQDETRVRTQFAQRFERFASPEQGNLVREIF